MFQRNFLFPLNIHVSLQVANHIEWLSEPLLPVIILLRKKKKKKKGHLPQRERDTQFRQGKAQNYLIDTFLFF